MKSLATMTSGRNPEFATLEWFVPLCSTVHHLFTKLSSLQLKSEAKRQCSEVIISLMLQRNGGVVNVCPWQCTVTL
jgi:hypothetical protein